MKMAIKAQWLVVEGAPANAVKLANGKHAILRLCNVGFAAHSGNEVPGPWVDVMVVS